MPLNYATKGGSKASPSSGTASFLGGLVLLVAFLEVWPAELFFRWRKAKVRHA